MTRTDRKRAQPRTDAEIRRILEAEPRNADGCWERQGGTQNGYAKVGYQGERWTAHRVAWTVFCGPIPKGKYVCHHCDNRRCCNPEHLFLGTQKDNIVDMFAKERQSTSQQRATYGNAKLSRKDLDLIRDLYVAGFSQRKIGAFFGVHQTAISKVIRGESWKS